MFTVGALALLVLAYGGVSASHHHDLDDHGERLDHTCFVCETSSPLDATGAVSPSLVALPPEWSRPLPAHPGVVAEITRRPGAARAPPALPSR